MVSMWCWLDAYDRHFGHRIVFRKQLICEMPRLSPRHFPIPLRWASSIECAGQEVATSKRIGGNEIFIGRRRGGKDIDARNDPCNGYFIVV